MLNTYLQVFFITLAFSFVLTPIIRNLALRYNFISKPKKDRWNRRIIPICGGAAIFLSFLVSGFMYARGGFFLPLISGATAIFFCGLIDDIFSIKPYSKLFAQIVIAAFMCMAGITFKMLPIPFLNILVTIFWFVAIMNAFNILDNMDGLCAGITVISAGSVFAYYSFCPDYNVAIIALLMGAAALGFLRYNFNPAKIFMGDCGSMFIGFVMAAISVMGTWRGASNLIGTLAIPVLVLAVPVFDTILVTLTRCASGRHFYQGGKDHVSHRLVVLGMSERRAVLTLYLMSFSCGLIAFIHARLNIALGTIIILLLALFMLFFGIFLSQVKIYSKNKEQKKENIDGHIFLSGMIYHKQKMLEIIVDLFLISASYVGAYLLRYEGALVDANLRLILESMPIVIIVKLSSFYLFGLYRGVWQYVGIYDLFNVIKAVTVGCVASIIALVFMFRIEGYSRAVFFIDWLILLMVASGARLAMRMFSEYFNFDSVVGKRIFIIGAGDAGEYLLRGLRHNKKNNYIIIGFIDDNSDKHGRKIHGVPILGGRHEITGLVKKYKVGEVVVAIPSLDAPSFSEIEKICHENNVACRKISDINLW